MNLTFNKTDILSLSSLFTLQQKQQFVIANRSIADRKEKLKQLQNAIENTYRQAIQNALYQDFGKSATEVDLTEIFPTVSEIKYVTANLAKWTRKQTVKTPLPLIGSSSYIQYEPKGVCLVIAPWNFPLLLSLSPLVTAIAAGNTVIIKPSEHTPHTSKIIQEIVNQLFEPQQAAVVLGGIETSTELLTFPFNHIFFTGAPEIGKIVMTAAAKNLASVTLELGGKSPTIIDETADIEMAARRVAWGKCLNAGQICVAPDYVFVHENQRDMFITSVQTAIKNFYNNNPETSPDYTRIVNQKHTSRLQNYLQDAVLKGARVISGGKSNVESKYIEPTLVIDVPLHSDLMQQEIFGPILPILTYKNLDEVTDFINARHKPLALYLYSRSKKNIQFVLKNTRAGGTCINHNNVHFSNHYLPFGGSNNSGIGKAHGFFGFKAFSNERGVQHQYLPSAIDLFTPPYTDFKKKLVNLVVKWF